MLIFAPCKHPFQQILLIYRPLRGSFFPLAAPEWEDFSEIWQPFEAKRKVILTSEGEVEKYIYFVLEGVQRAYAVGEDGREATLVFTYPYSFSGVADSLLLQQASRYYFETLTPGRFLRSTFRQLDELMLKHHGIERMIRLALSHTLAGVLQRQIELQSFSAEQRFRALLTRISQQPLRSLPVRIHPAGCRSHIYRITFYTRLNQSMLPH